MCTASLPCFDEQVCRDVSRKGQGQCVRRGWFQHRCVTCKGLAVSAARSAPPRTDASAALSATISQRLGSAGSIRKPGSAGAVIHTCASGLHR